MEEVLVTKRSIIDPIGQSATEILGLPDDFSERIEGNLFFVPRNEAENDFTLKQIIPYAVIIGEKGIFVMKRTKKQTEKRLHDKLSVGVGGHINRSDIEEKAASSALNGEKLIRHGMKRELDEEVGITGEYTIELLGCINDNSTEVGQVHFGICYLVRLLGGDVFVRETEKMTGEWMSLAEAEKKIPDLESWSAIAVSALSVRK